MARLRKIFLWTMIASLGLDAVIGIAALLLPSYGPVEELLGSAALFAAFSLVALLCAIVIERGRLVPVMWSGVACSGTALVLWIVLIWGDRAFSFHVSEAIARLGGTFTVVAVVTAQCGLIGLVRFDRRAAAAAKWATIGISVMLAVYALIMIWWGEQISRVIDDDFLARSLGVLVILALCGTVITPILWKVQSVRHADAAGSMPVKVKMRVTCPRCNTDQHVTTGRAKCSSCGLEIVIEVEEPRCRCGYLLHRLESDRCPECGRIAPERDRWAALTDPGTGPTSSAAPGSP